YLIQTSIDGVEWTTVFTETNGNGGLDDLSLNGQGRYLRMFGQKRFTRYGFSLWEIEVFGSLPVIPEPEPVPEPEPELVLAPGAVNLALNRPATSSSNESATLTADMAFDGTANSRWSSSLSDNQWV